MTQNKFIRYPYLNEGTDKELRDNVRIWLKQQNYRNARISADNEDPIFSAKINKAKKLGKAIDHQKVYELFESHIVSSLECSDNVARKLFGRSPKHVLLLHEADATVLFIKQLVTKLRKDGWKIIPVLEAYSDPIYFEEPLNMKAWHGIISQLEFERTGSFTSCYDYRAMVKKLNELLAL